MDYMEDDQEYYSRGNGYRGYPTSGLQLDETRRSNPLAMKFQILNSKEQIGENTSRQDADERPKKFPVKNELDEILRKVRSVLNKISALNYGNLQKRWVNIIPSEPEQLKEVLQLLVQKAIEDPMYMRIYARLASDVLDANPSISHSLRNILCNHIHHALQELSTDMELAKFGRLDEDAARRRKVMLYRFIAELFVANVCNTRFVTERITDLIGQGRRIPPEADEPLECICVLLMFAGSKLEEDRGAWLNDVFVTLSLTEASGLPTVSKRMQFMLLDLLEMRANSWKPQSKWWAQSVPIRDSNIDVELNNLKAVRSMNNRRNKRNTPSPRRAKDRNLRTILNLVVPSNLDRMASEFQHIFQSKRSIEDASVENVVKYILRTPDSKFIRVQSALLSKVCTGCPLLRTKLVPELFKCVQENPDSIPVIQVCTELYISGVISLGQIITTLQKNVAKGVESACVFFHRAQSKLFREWNRIKHLERTKIRTLVKTLHTYALEYPNRLHCMVKDVNDLLKNKWGNLRPLFWSPLSFSTRTRPFNAENAISTFNTNEEDGLEFLQESLGTNRDAIAKFAENMCIWTILRADIRILGSCGRYLKSIVQSQLLGAEQLPKMNGALIQAVARMRDRPDAWANFGIIMHELYSPSGGFQISAGIRY